MRSPAVIILVTSRLGLIDLADQQIAEFADGEGFAFASTRWLRPRRA
jgi:hypothetical protein